MVGGQLMNNKDYQANYGQNSEFELFVGGEGEGITTPRGFQYERRDGIIFQLTEKGFDKEVDVNVMRRNEGLPGFNKLSQVNLDEEKEVPYILILL